MDVAILGLIGVVVGALVTGGVQLFIDWRKERRVVSRARRLVTGELLNAELMLGLLATLRTWPTLLHVDSALPTSAWRENRGHLTDVLDERLWSQLVLVYTGIEADRGRLTLAKNSPGVALTQDDIVGLKSSVKTVQALRHALGGRGAWQEEISDGGRTKPDEPGEEGQA